MGRPSTLTEEEKIQKKKERNELVFCIKFPSPTEKSRLEKVAKNYQSMNFCILDLIRTHPDYLKIFPKNKLTLKKS